MRERKIHLSLTETQLHLVLELVASTAKVNVTDQREVAETVIDEILAATEYHTSATVCEGHPDRRATWELAIFGPVQTIVIGMCDGCALAARTDTTTAESPEALIPLVWCEAGHWVGTAGWECSCATLVPWTSAGEDPV